MTSTADDAARRVVEEAWRQAAAAATRSQVLIRTLTELEDLRGVVALFDRVWSNTGPPVIGLEHLRALAHAGNYVAAAFDPLTGTMLGATVAFFASPPGKVLHSDVTGVDQAARDRQLGFSLKVHQRAWCLAQGIAEVTWTYDPLVARNAHFNINKLRARGVHYYVDFYGEMADGVNLGQGSDRLLMSWQLTSREVAAASDLEPPRVALSVADLPALVRVAPDGPLMVSEATPDDPKVLVGIPDDIDELRRVDRDAAVAWRRAVRETLGAELAAGGTLTGFDRTAGYLVERGPE